MKIETVMYEIEWSKFKKGHSFFVPCIDVANAKLTIQKVAHRLDIAIVTKVIIVDGIKGIRVWRV